MRSLSQNTITVHPERLRLSNNRIGHMMPVAVPTISPRNQTCDLGLFIFLFFIFLNHQFITRGAKVDRGKYIVPT